MAALTFDEFAPTKEAALTFDEFAPAPLSREEQIIKQNEGRGFISNLGRSVPLGATKAVAGLAEFGANVNELLGRPRPPGYRKMLAELQRGYETKGTGTGTAGFIGEVLGNPATYLPGSPVVQGAVMGVTTPTGDENSTILGNALNSAIGAGAGYAGQKAGNYVAKKAGQAAGYVGRQVGNLPKPLDDEAITVELANRGVDLSSYAPEVRKSLLLDTRKALKATGDFDVEALARKADLEALGLQPTTAQITRNPQAWQFEQNTAGLERIGDPLRNRFAEQNLKLKGALETVGTGTGGKAGTPYEAGRDVTEAVTKKYAEMQDDVGKLYGEIRSSVGEKYGLYPEKLMAQLDEVSDEAAADPVVASVKRRLAKFGVVDSSGAAVTSASGKSRPALTVEQGEKLRQFINRLSDSNDPAVRRIKSGLINALDDDVIEGAGVDSFKQARDAARARFQEFESDSLNRIVSDKIYPEDIVRNAFSGGKIDDLRATKASLLGGNAEQQARGLEAWNNARAQVLNQIAENSTDASGKLQGSRLNKELKKLGKERLELLFSPAEAKQIQQIARAAEYTTTAVADSRVNYSGTGAMLANLAGRMGAANKVGQAANAAINLPYIGPALATIAGPLKMTADAVERAAQAKAVQNSLGGNIPVGMGRTIPAGTPPYIAGAMQRLLTNAALTAASTR